jgi:hypothetical protein
MLRDHLKLNVETADQYLQHFHSMALYFPFVVIPASTSISELARARPMLSLAIFTVSSMQDRPLQAKLEVILRTEFAERIMVQQEKNLDLLSALLVYLGWSHFYYIPKRDSLSQFMSLATAICNDLGLGLSKDAAMAQRHRINLDHCSGAVDEISAEAKRLYLGTYFLLNTYSWSFAESSRIADWEHVVACADFLAIRNEYATDALVSCLVRMQYLALRYHTLFSEYAGAEVIDPLQIAAQLDDAEIMIAQVRQELPPVLRQSGEQQHALVVEHRD